MKAHGGGETSGGSAGVAGFLKTIVVIGTVVGCGFWFVKTMEEQDKLEKARLSKQTKRSKPRARPSYTRK